MEMIKKLKERTGCSLNDCKKALELCNDMNVAYEYLRNGKVIGIFPEGTFGKGKILPFKMGAVKMAYETKSEIGLFLSVS